MRRFFKKHFKLIIIIPILALTTSLSFGQSIKLSPELKERIDQFENFVRYQMVVDKAVGLSMAFLQDQNFWAKGFGYADLENKVPAKPESSYRLASITKTITAIAVLQLAEQGRLNLDADIRTYVPYFPPKRWPIPVRLLLGHLGGISHYRNYAEEGRIREHKNTREAIAIFANFDLVAEPGTNYHYSSYGFNLLGAAIEAASGISYGEYIQNNIFLPLGMSNSRLDDPLDIIPNRVRGYQLIKGEIKNSEYVDISSRFAAGGTRSTVLDLMKYARGIIDQKLLKPHTWRQMFTSMSTRDGYFTGYGMGWGVRPWRGHFQVSHSGSQPETRTHLLIFLTENFALAIASNRERLDLMPYVRRLAEIVLDEDLDLQVYLPTREARLLYQALEETFSYGLSQFDWNKAPLTSDTKELAKSFAYFNQNLDLDSLRKNWTATRTKIKDGIHPLSGQAFTKVGTWMAFCLAERMGRASFKKYHHRGALAFYQDYLSLERENLSSPPYFPLVDSLAKIIQTWAKEWNQVYTEDVRHLFITPQTDFNQLFPWLEKKFSKAKIYPDYTRDFGRVAGFYLRQHQEEKALTLLQNCLRLYPQSPLALVQLAQVNLWLGQKEKARRLYLRAQALDPETPSLSLAALENFAAQLEESNHWTALKGLVEIALELYPENPDVLEKGGDIYLQLGEKTKALELYNQALEKAPQRKHLLEKIKKIKEKK